MVRVRVAFIIAERGQGEVAAAVYTQNFSHCRCQASAAMWAWSSPCAHRVHKVATGMSPSPQAAPIKANVLSELFGYPVKLMKCDGDCAASAQAIVSVNATFTNV